MTAYQRYQLQWMIDHDKSIDDLIDEIGRYQDGNEITDGLKETFWSWENDAGFGGEIWACFGEWVDCEESDECKLFQAVIDKLPNNPPANGLEDECPIWTDGTEILCRTEWLAMTIADILDNIIGDRFTHYHYYDPEEDERNNEVDSHTGWWYVDFD